MALRHGQASDISCDTFRVKKVTFGGFGSLVLHRTYPLRFFFWVVTPFFELTICHNINSQLDATITDFIDNYNQLNMFRAIISPILTNTRLAVLFGTCSGIRYRLIINLFIYIYIYFFFSCLVCGVRGKGLDELRRITVCALLHMMLWRHVFG